MTSVLIFLSAFLLFQIEPLISKVILPWYGGVASVWTTCLLFFQSILVLGYGWALLLSRLRTARSQLMAHLLLVWLGVLLLPVYPAADLRPHGGEDPVMHLLYVLMHSIGAPFFVLSSTAPLLQDWYHRFKNEQSPYWLYSVSNFGSFLGLLSYPFIMEPLLDLRSQADIWSRGFICFALIMTVLIAAYFRAGTKAAADREASRAAGPQRTSLGVGAFWFLLSACTSAMLLATTNHICHDVASIPLLWVFPLALFLLSFVITFADGFRYRRSAYILVLALALAGLALISQYSGPQALVAVIVCALLAQFAGSLLCNAELVRIKPDASELPKFYLVTALGGAAGALFVAVGAPFLFTDYHEFHLSFLLCVALILACMARRDGLLKRLRIGDGAAALLVCLFAVAAAVVSVKLSHAAGNVVSLRSFFGVTRIREEQHPQLGPVRQLFHGRIMHGMQVFNQPGLPTAYFGPGGGLGRTLNALSTRPELNIAVIGLGIGTAAAYGRPADRFTFWEINPDIQRVAHEHFSFLKDSPAQITIELGDGRLGIDRSTDHSFDLIVIDAFNGDSIPVHLITKEALGLYLSKLRDRGVIVFQVSNIYLKLAPVVARLAAEFGLAGRRYEYDGNAASGEIPSEYVVLSRDPEFFEVAPMSEGAKPLELRAGDRIWTDSYASILKVMR